MDAVLGQGYVPAEGPSRLGGGLLTREEIEVYFLVVGEAASRVQEDDSLEAGRRLPPQLETHGSVVEITQSEAEEEKKEKNDRPDYFAYGMMLTFSPCLSKIAPTK